MKSITQLLIMGAFGLALGIGGTFVYAKNVLLPQQTKTIQNYVKKTNDLEQELKAFKEDKEGASTKEIPIPKHSYSHQEYVNLKSIGEQFSKSYYDITTDTAEEKLKGLSKILTPKLSGKLRPAWVDDYKNSIRIEQETISEQYYVKLNGVTGKATMIGLHLGDLIDYMLDVIENKNENNIDELLTLQKQNKKLLSVIETHRRYMITSLKEKNRKIAET